jgi:hypothetical protein
MHESVLTASAPTACLVCDDRSHRAVQCPTPAGLLHRLANASVALQVAQGTHALLRTFLEARGVRPWTLLDSLGASPVLLLGALLLGTTGGVLAAWWLTCPGLRCAVPSVGVLLALLLAAAGVLATWLGLLALRKFT